MLQMVIHAEPLFKNSFIQWGWLNVRIIDWLGCFTLMKSLALLSTPIPNKDRQDARF